MIVPRQRILILCKTYPSPSARYVETSCVAGMAADGRLVRLFPVPFRLVEEERQFRKWQWIRARVRKATDDNRPESFRISVDTIAVEGDPLPTQDGWLARRRVLASLEVFEDFADLEAARLSRGVSLGLYRPSRLLEVSISATSSPDWTEEELAKLMQAQRQGIPIRSGCGTARLEASEETSLRLPLRTRRPRRHSDEAQAGGLGGGGAVLEHPP